MPKLVADLAGRQAIARKLIISLNLTQDACGKIIADINALNDWDDDMESNDIARDFNKLSSSLADSHQGTAIIIPLRSSSELFYKLFVVWAMQTDESRIATLPYSIRNWMLRRPWWRDAMIEFGTMVRGQYVEIDWLDNLFQQFADEPPSKTKKRRQIANVAPADQPRLLRRTLVSAPHAVEDTPSDRKVAKRKQDSQTVSNETTNASGLSPAQPSKKIKSNTPNVSNAIEVTPGASSKRTHDITQPRGPQLALQPSSSGDLSTTTFGLGLPGNVDASNRSLATQPGSNLVGRPKIKSRPTRVITLSIAWHPAFIKVKKERDDLASQLAKANEQLKEKDTRYSELYTQVSSLMYATGAILKQLGEADLKHKELHTQLEGLDEEDLQHEKLHTQLASLKDMDKGILEGFNKVDLECKQLRAVAMKILSSTEPPQQPAAAPTLTGHGDAASTTGNPGLQGQSLPQNRSNATRKWISGKRKTGRRHPRYKLEKVTTDSSD